MGPPPPLPPPLLTRVGGWRDTALGDLCRATSARLNDKTVGRKSNGQIGQEEKDWGEREVGVTEGGSSTVNTGPALTAVPCAGTPSNSAQGKFAGLPLSSCMKLSLALLGKDLTGYIRSLEHRQLLVPLLRILVCG